MISALVREELRRAALGRPVALTIGVFDGVHRGHRALLEQVVERAAAAGFAAAAVTFHPHPRTVVRPDTHVAYLTSLEDRLDLLLDAGLDSVAPLTFTSDLAQAEAVEFMGALVQELRMRRLIVGPDFALGRQRSGDVTALTRIGEQLGYDVDVVDLVLDGGAKVSSSEIRRALESGEIRTVCRLLGRPFTLRGPVIHGAERGRVVGFRTANIAVGADRALPGPGVYATIAALPEGPRASVTNVGVRPTFDDGGRITVECHVLDLERDLYGCDLRIELVARIRAERKFSSVEDLTAQIRRDCDAARAALADPQAP